MHLDHPRLLVSRFADCFRFYRDLLGLKVTWGDEDAGYASFTDPGGNAIVLALFNRDAMAEVIGTGDLPTDAPCQDRVALIFAVDDVDATVDALRQRGARIVLDPRDFADWGIRSAYLRDPDGTLIELHSELDRAQWSQQLRDANQKYADT